MPDYSGLLPEPQPRFTCRIKESSTKPGERPAIEVMATESATDADRETAVAQAVKGWQQARDALPYREHP